MDRFTKQCLCALGDNIRNWELCKWLRVMPSSRYFAEYWGTEKTVSKFPQVTYMGQRSVHQIKSLNGHNARQ